MPDPMPDPQPKSAAELSAEYNALAAQCTAAQARRNKLRPELEARIKKEMQIADGELASLLKRKGIVAQELRQAQALEAQAASEQHDADSANEAAKIASEGLADDPDQVLGPGTVIVDVPADEAEAACAAIEAPKPEPASTNRRRR